MIGTTDWTGLAAVIAAIGSAVAAVIAAWFGARNSSTLGRSANGTPVATQLENVAAAVSTPPGVGTLGQIASDAVDTVEEIHNVVTNSTPPGGTKT